MVAEQNNASNSPYSEDVENAAAIFAKFAHLLNPNVDEFHAFTILRDYIVSEGIHIETIEELVYLLQETFFDPQRDKLH